MGGDDQFRTHTLLFCIIFFIVLSSCHVLALYVKGSMEIHELKDQLARNDISLSLRSELEQNLDNMSQIDFWDVLSGIGNILFGLELPTVFTILISLVNGIVLVLIAVLSWSFIKAHIPFITG